MPAPSSSRRIPTTSARTTRWARTYFGRQDYAAAIAEYEKATAINPAFSQPYNQMGYAYRFLGKYAEAEQAFKKYIELIPGDPNPYDSYAELLMKMGRFEESIKNYEKALAVDPNFVASYIGIGNDRVFMGAATGGASYLRQAGRGRAQRRREAAGALLDRAVVRARGRHRQGAGRDREDGGIDEAGKDLAALSGDLQPDGRHPAARPAAWTRRAARYKEQAGDHGARRDVPAEVKEATRRQHLFDEARVALARKDLAGAKAKAAAYATAVAAQEDPVRGAAAARAGGAHRARGEAAMRRRSPSSRRPTSRTRACST